MNALIVEDEELAVRKLRKLLQEVAPTLAVAGVAASIEDTVAWLESRRAAGEPEPDLIFLDIELADGQSFEIFERTPVHSTVIFTTSYDEYALQAFKVNSIDYLLKPVQREELARSLRKYEELRRHAAPAAGPALNIEKLLQQLQQQAPREYRQRFLVRQGQRLLSVETGDIAYFYTDERYSFFATHAGQKFLVDYTLDELTEALDPARFFRINRGMLVTHQAVEQMQPYFGNRLALTFRPAFDKDALVSREKVSDFKTWMGK
ncbi:LytR/AlgR family response regulator transcription factor [Hymenobacter ruricola]|uniref:Response regulator transcription factor n=1 Tax=Hymenobacter ruricola TaxID=2791023 RepID=A0ABS0HZ64_9BACT|nr:LytTR family DNA-binding domain-containing protein [Hymenobacter ruricola]MBF9219831.1 response regulator transcription factor [Hymenobacter ruricola]